MRVGQLAGRAWPLAPAPAPRPAAGLVALPTGMGSAAGCRVHERQSWGLRAAAGSRSLPVVTLADRLVVEWVSEQYAIRADQLERLLGCAQRTRRVAVARLRAAGLVDAGPVVHGEPGWVWLTSKGARSAASGFGVWRVRPALLAHVAAVNEVRLHVATRAPEALWVCERQLARELDRGAHLPDAVVCVGPQRHAIEVELTPKARARTQAILCELSGRYDVVYYFCAPAARRQLDELAASGRWPSLVVRGLPEASG